MREKILCECTKCGKAFIATNPDGLCCDECKGLLKPIDSVKNMKENLKAMQDGLDKATDLTKKKKENTLLGYRIYTKEDYKRYLLANSKAECNMNGIIKNFEEHWQRISKGYNFIVGVGKESSMMVYSVEYFNDNVLGDSEDKHETLKKQVTIQEINKLMTETLTKANETISMIAKDFKNRVNNGFNEGV
ncbi:hypothetical protein Z962_p0102 (plasmid) [Clostridium botulinum C/D str. BKT12695]|nr:hypothetical protein Z962_p0102 [Clostridium botulinum C/D str. BKT12695]